MLRNVQRNDGAVLVNAFGHNVRKIAAHRDLTLPADGDRVWLPPFSWRADLRTADAKSKAGELPAAVRVGIWSSPCYLCSRGPALGIDRNYTTAMIVFLSAASMLVGARPPTSTRL